MRRVLAFVVILALAGCQALLPSARTVPSTVAEKAVAGAQQGVAMPPTAVRGNLRIDQDRAVQSTVADVVNGAIVGFLDSAGNPVATTKTDAAGNFSLSVGGFAPVANQCYVLEATRGLNNQRPGYSAARFRTILKWNGTAWQSITSTGSVGPIVINQRTTALAIASALDSVGVPMVRTIGKVDTSSNPSVFVAPTLSGASDPLLENMATEVMTSLTADADPVGSMPVMVPTITSVNPLAPYTGPAGGVIQITGQGFSAAPSGNTVKFGALAATVVLASATSLIVQVPSSAQSGFPVTVQTARGTATSASNFNVAGSIGGGGSFSTAPSIWTDGLSVNLGRVGTAVTLNGSYGTPTATPTVSFSGPGTPIKAIVSSWNSSTINVTVPLGSVSGYLYVQSQGVTATSPEVFTMWPGDITTTISVNNPSPTSNLYQLPSTLYAHCNAQYGSSWQYIIGGYNGSAAVSTIYAIRMNPDGSCGAARVVGNLATARYYAAACVASNSLIVSGGYTGSSSLNSIEIATINPLDGSLSNIRSGGTLKASRYNHGMFGYKDKYVHMFFGNGVQGSSYGDEYWTLDNSGNLTYTGYQNLDIYYAGSAGYYCSDGYYWDQFSLVQTGDRVTLIGGYNNGWGWLNGAYTWQLTPSSGAVTYQYSQWRSHQGTGTSWIRPAVALCTNNSQIFVTTSTNTNMFRYDLAGTGEVTGYADLGANTCPNPVRNTVGFSNGNNMFVVAGQNKAGNTSYSGVYSTPVSAGTVGTWNQSRLSTPGNFSGLQLVDKAWRFGGFDGVSTATNSTVYVQINADGTCGSPTAGLNMVAARYFSSAVQTNGYALVIGGRNYSSALSSIEKSTINIANGTMGSWATQAATLGTARYNFSAAVINGYLYVMGGRDNSGALLSSIERFSIDATGNLSNRTTLQLTLPEARFGMGVPVQIGNYIYLVGGTIQTGVTGTVLVATVYPDGTVGNFTRGLSLVTPVTGANITQIGNYLYCFSGTTDGYSGTTLVQRAMLMSDGALYPWEKVQPGGMDILPTPHYDLVAPPYVYNNVFYLFNGFNVSSDPTVLTPYARGMIR